MFILHQSALAQISKFSVTANTSLQNNHIIATFHVQGETRDALK